MFAFPNAFNATIHPLGIKIPASVLSQSLINWASSGAIRISSDTLSYIIHRPHGFTAKYARYDFTLHGKITKRATIGSIQSINAINHIHLIGWTISSTTEKIGTPGHLFERAVAVELTIPLSPLYQKLFDALEAKNLAPDNGVFMQSVKFTESIQDKVNNLQSKIHLVFDKAHTNSELADKVNNDLLLLTCECR
jgi:hypothetical protein